MRVEITVVNIVSTVSENGSADNVILSASGLDFNFELQTKDYGVSG
jgi:hypothetical protein